MTKKKDGNSGKNSELADSQLPSDQEKLIEKIMQMTLSLLFKENPEETIDEMGKIIMDIFPIRTMITYIYDEEAGEFVPRGVFGYPEEMTKEIKEKLIYYKEELEKYDRIGRPLGKFSIFYPAESIDRKDERERLTTLDKDGIDLPRANENAWHPLDRADIRLLDRSGKEIGDIGITSTTTGKLLDKETVYAMEIFASIGSMALELARLRKEEQEHGDIQEKRSMQMSNILSVASLILTMTDLSKLLDRILEQIMELFEFKSAAIALYDEYEDCYRWRALRGYTDEEFNKAINIRIPKEVILEEDLLPEYQIGYLAHFVPAEKLLPKDLDYFFFPDDKKQEALQLLKLPRESKDSWHRLDDLIFSILDGKGNVIGVLCPDNPINSRIPTREEIEVIEIFVSLVAIALENTDIYSKTVSSRDEIHILNRIMFHDLMNYSMAISGYLDLAFTSEPEELRQYITKAVGQTELIDDLINKIKKLSQIRSADKRNFIRIDLGRTIRNQASKSAKLFPLKKVKFSFDFGKKESYVTANDLLPDLFHNIFINAIKFDLSNKVNIEVKIEETKKEEGGRERKAWRVAISDRGPGVPDERKEIIFLGSSRLSEPIRGMGLGLSIVKSLTDLYGGKIWVEDRVAGNYAKGSVFFIELPVA